MAEDNDRVDNLIEESKTPTIVVVAAGALGLEGLLLAMLGVQHFVFVDLLGAWRAVPIVQLALGVLTMAAAFNFGKARPFGAWAGLAFMVIALLGSGLWLVVSIWLGLFSLLSFVSVGGAVVALVLVLVGVKPCLDAARATQRLMAGELAGAEAMQEYQREAARARRTWVVGSIIFVFLLAIFGGIVTFLVQAAPGRPTRVLLVTRGSLDEVFDRSFERRFQRELESHGLEVVVAETALAADQPLEAARDLAREADAGHAVVAQVTASQEREGAVSGTSLFAVTATVSLVPGGEGETESESIEFAFEGATAGDVAGRVGDAWAGALTPWVLDRLFISPAFEAVLDGNVVLEEVEFATKLRAADEFVKGRRKLAQGYRDYCSRERENLKALSQGDVLPVQCAGDPCGQYTLIGVDSKNRAIVQDISRTPVFPVTPMAKARWIEPAERILALSLDGSGEEQQLLRSGHFYGFGNVTRDGRFATVQPFGIRGTLAVYVLDLGTGAQRDKALLMPRERTSWTLPHPEGEGLLAQIRRGPWMYLQGSKRVEIPRLDRTRWVRYGDGYKVVGQLRSRELVFTGTDGFLTEQRIMLPGRVVEFFPPAGGVSITESPLSLIVESDSGCDLVRVNVAAQTAEVHRSMPRCLRRPRMLNDGRVVGIAPLSAEGDVPGDPEVVLWDPETAAMTPLTSGPFIEEGPEVTHDGARVVFNRRLESWPDDYDVHIYRRVVCWVDVPERAAPAAPE